MTKQDIDLQKLQFLESSYQGWFNFKASIIAGTTIGTLILVATMLNEKIINVNGAGIGYLIIMIFAIYFIRDMKQTHKIHISFINDLILKIEKGEKLASIEELRQKHKDSPKK